MSSWQLGIDLVTTFLLASYLLFRYGNWYKHHVFVTLSVLVAWYFSLLFVFVLPIDISGTAYRQCVDWANSTLQNSTTNSTEPPCTVPPSYVSASVMTNLWRVVYWTSQLLTWLILPMMQSYVQAGEFTIKGKLRSALLDNAIYYGSYLFICGILLAYIAVKPDLELDWYKLKAIASSASNTWGLFLLVFMLGYGLISVPLTLYTSSSERRSLNVAYFKVAKLSTERSSAEEAIDDVIETLQLCVKSTNSLPPQLANNLQTIVSTLPVELREKMARRRVNETINEVNDKLLVKLHRNVKRALQAFNRTETQYERAITHAIYLEDVERSLNSGTRIFKHTFETSRAFWNHLPNSFEWFTRCVVHSYGLKVLSLMCWGLSFMIIWSEVTFFNKSPVLSFFALLLNSTRSVYPYMEFICTLTIAYMATCAFYTIFKIRVFNFYYISSSHQTDEYSLIFAGMLLCRLTPPLCLNMLSLFHLDSHVINKRILETSYTQVMGHMDVITLISDGFNVYFPIGILLVSIMTWFRVGSRILNKIGFQQFLPDDEIATELVNEGSQLVIREKRRRQRTLDNADRATRKYHSRADARASAAESANVAVENLRNLSTGDDMNDPDDNFYSRVLIEDSSSSRVRVYGTSPPHSATSSTTQHHHYYQNPDNAPPRGLFDDV
ncbi:LMBR1 domain-containing protein 2 [Orchesella cincta]|uniref:LMBR1 domain-containing protein 2 n=1 Tax=Orchesella cincta TaxID=48709 RepID=A0A1D2MJH5_ORCCI|nr:LMBR1 domain-containing protein 2 [Orchesella cincta]